MNIQDVDVAVKLMTAVMEGFALMEIDDDDFDSLFHAIKYHADNRMPIGRIQFEYVFLNDENRLRVGFALSPMILCSAKAKYRGINTVKWFINLPNMDIDFSETTVPSFLAKSQVGLIETPNYDFEDLAQFMDEERLPFFN